MQKMGLQYQFSLFVMMSDDCIDGTDESLCKCSFMGPPKVNSTSCVSKCQRPTCTCHQPMDQRSNSGCKPFISQTTNCK